MVDMVEIGKHENKYANIIEWFCIHNRYIGKTTRNTILFWPVNIENTLYTIPKQ